MFGAFLSIMLQSIHPWTKPSRHKPPGSRQHLWRGLSECAGQCKNNCKHIIQGVLYHLCTIYWHFLDAVCFANVMSHRIKWRAVPGKPHNLTGSGTELSGNPQNSQPELWQVISIQVLQAFKSITLVEERLSKMSVTGEKGRICLFLKSALNLMDYWISPNSIWQYYFSRLILLRTKELDTPYNME